MADPTFDCPDLDSFCLIDRLDLTVTGQHVGTDHTVLACRVVEPDDVTERSCWCTRCGELGVPRDTVLRRLAHVPVGWRPTVLDVTVRRYRCLGCEHAWRQDTTAAAAPRAKLTRAAVLWALKSVVVDRMSIARVAEGLGASWHTVNDAVLDAGQQLLIEDPTRLEGVRVLGVDEHCWRHTRHGGRFVTVIIDLTPVRDGTLAGHVAGADRQDAAVPMHGLRDARGGTPVPRRAAGRQPGRRREARWSRTRRRCRRFAALSSSSIGTTCPQGRN